MRIVDGLEEAGVDDISLGDVYPYPGDSGRRIGDGRLTREDALTILRKEIGLVSEIEFNANYERSSPWIDDIFPTSGEAGDQVLLIGGNFITHPAGDNSAFLGDQSAEILETAGNVLVVRVPDNAHSGFFRVHTPGGVAESPFEFRVTHRLAGELDVGNSLNPSDFMIASSFDEEPVDDSGRFQIQVQLDELTLVGAVTNDESVNNNFLSLVFPGGDASTTFDPHNPSGGVSFRIDALSTAKTLVFLCPFLFTSNLANAKVIYESLGTHPDVQALADVIAVRYADHADGLDDPDVEAAYIKAVQSYINSLPAGMTVSLDGLSSAAKTGRSVGFDSPISGNAPIGYGPVPEILPNDSTSAASLFPLSANTGRLSVRQYNVDRFDVNAGYDEKKNQIKPYLKDKYGPLDYITILYRIDPNDLPQGVNESFLSLRKRPLKITGYRVGNVLQGSLWTAKIDVAYNVIDLLFSKGGEYVMKNVLPEDLVNWYKGSDLPLEDFEEGVYMLRIYSGALVDNDVHAYDFESIDNIPGGEGWHYFACTINIMQAAVDFWDLITPDSYRWSRTFFKKGIKNAIRRITAETAGVRWNTLSASEIAKITMRMMVDFLVAAGTTTPQKGLSIVQAKLKSSASASIKKGILLLEVLDRVSSGGRVVERMLGLAGQIIRPQFPKRLPIMPDFSDPNFLRDPEQYLKDSSFFVIEPVGPTPLESILFVVGQPFDPIVDSVEPSEGKRGDRVIITGRKLMPLNGSVDVRFAGEKAAIIAAENTRLIVEVPPVLIPDGVTNRLVELTVETSASVEKTLDYFTVIRFPYIQAIEPSVGYARASNQPTESPVYSFPGTEVILKGDELFIQNQTPSRYVKIGDTNADVIRESGVELTMRLPYVDPGETEIYIADFNRETSRIPFTILGKPEITSIYPAEAKSGQFVEITGTNLSTIFSKDYKQLFVDIREKGADRSVYTRVEKFTMDSASFQIDNPVENDTALLVKVWNPAGVSDEWEIVLKPGVVTYSELNKPAVTKGLLIPVTTNEYGMTKNGRISLDEAAAFARGDEDPFSAKWDDRNERWTITRTERKEIIGHNDEGNPIYRYVWQESLPEKVTLDSGNGPWAEERKIYFIDIYHSDHGGNITDPYYVSSVNLDENEEDREEGDLISVFSDLIDLFGSITTYNGAAYADEIHVQVDSDNEVHVENPAIGVGDKLWVDTSASLKIEGGFVQDKSHCDFLFRDVISTGPIVVKGSGIQMRWDSMAFESEGFKLEEVFACWLYGNAITRSQGEGLRVQGGGGHLLNIGEIANCAYSGVFIDSSNQNNFHGVHGAGPDVHHCAYGFVLEQGKRNTIWVSAYENRENGIDLTNAFLNTISGASYNNAGNGVNVEGKCEENWIHVQSYSNVNGLEFKPGGNFEKNRIGGAYYNNRQYGIYLKDSANYNSFHEVNVHGNGSHGILLEGSDSGKNDFIRCFIGLPDVEKANGGDGIRIQYEVLWTLFDNCHITGNEGNGIYLGPEVNHVEMKNCRIGHTDLNYDPALHYPNQGWGLLAPEKPMELSIENSVFGINKLGGMRIVGPQTYEYGAGPPLSIEKTLVGYKYTVYGIDKNFLFSYPGLSGIGVDLENVKSATFDTVYINSHDVGFRLQGQDSGLNVIHTVHVNKAAQTGAVIIQSVTDTLTNVLFTNNGGDGLRLESTQGTVVRDCPISFENNAGVGVAVQNCDQVVLDNLSLKKNSGHGIAVDHSTNTVIRRCEMRENGGDGVSFFNQCVGATLDWAASGYNKGNGFTFFDTTNILMSMFFDLGRLHTNTLRCSMNEGAGIHMRNCANVYIGVMGAPSSGLSIDENKKQGIRIEGDTTGRIVIQGNSINSNAEGGIRVEAGGPVMIGGLDESRGNFLSRNREFNIWGSGANTQLRILSNRMEIQNPNMTTFIGANKGIDLSDGIHDVRIDSNEIYNHKQNGIVIRAGAHDNVVQGNKIQYNAQNGILIQGVDAVHNNLTRNIITGNNGKGIKLEGGNNNIESPIMRRLSGMGENLSGVVNAPLGSVVEVYADYDDEGKIFLGSTRIQGNQFFIKAKAPLGRQLHGIVIDPEGNTSEFGPSEIFPGNRYDSLIYAAHFGDQTDFLYQTDTDDTPMRLTKTPFSEYTPKYSPRGDKIIYISNQSGNRDIWVMDNNGQNAYPLMQNPFDEYDPDWSPDGQSYLYVSEEDGNADVFLHRIIPEEKTGELSYNAREKTRTMKVIAGDAVGLHFTSVPGALTELRFFIENPGAFAWKIHDWTNNAPTGLLHEGVTNPSVAGWHVVSLDRLAVPSDFVVAFSPLQDNIPELGIATSGSYSVPWRYSAANNQWTFDWRFFMIEAVHEADPPRNLTRNPSMDHQPVWSPNGKTIAFTSNRSGAWDIRTMNADGDELTALTHGEGDNTSPAWSRAGNRIAFVSTRNGNPDIFIMNSDGSYAESVTENEAAETDPAWNPSGTKIYYSADYGSGREIYSISVGASNPMRITRSGGDAMQPNVAPLGFSLSPLLDENTAKIGDRPASASTLRVFPAVDRMPVNVSLPEIYAEPGEIVTMALSIRDAVELGSFNVHLLYDEDVLDLQSTSNDIFAINSLSVINPDRFDYDAGTIRYCGIRSVGFSGQGNVLDFVFHISDWLDEPDTHEIIIETIAMYDVLSNPLTHVIQHGLIHIDVESTDV
jgi:Tol biopolymer transport system component